MAAETLDHYNAIIAEIEKKGAEADPGMALVSSSSASAPVAPPTVASSPARSHRSDLTTSDVMIHELDQALAQATAERRKREIATINADAAAQPEDPKSAKEKKEESDLLEKEAPAPPEPQVQVEQTPPGVHEEASFEAAAADVADANVAKAAETATSSSDGGPRGGEGKPPTAAEAAAIANPEAEAEAVKQPVTATYTAEAEAEPSTAETLIDSPVKAKAEASQKQEPLQAQHAQPSFAAADGSPKSAKHSEPTGPARRPARRSRKIVDSLSEALMFYQDCIVELDESGDLGTIVDNLTFDRATVSTAFSGIWVALWLDILSVFFGRIRRIFPGDTAMQQPADDDLMI